MSIQPAAEQHHNPSADFGVAEEGWRLYRVWAVNEQGVCACRKRAACGDPGKHPASAHGINDASSDPEHRAALFSALQRANVGLATGRGSGVVVLEVDPRHGGMEALERLQAEHGPLPNTRLHESGGGGWHYLLALPDDVGPVPSRTFDHGVELKADGTGIVLPPSKHASGGRYKVVNWAPLAPVPTWVLGLALKPELSVVRGEGRGRAEQPTQSRFELPERIREGARNRTLYRYGCSLRAHGWKHAEILAELRRANEERCVDQQERRAAPLGDAEVHKIAASAARHEPGTASWATTEVLEVLDGIEAALWEVTWPGTGGKSERSVMVALIKTARRHGTLIPAGVRVSIATRQLAEAAQMPHRSLMRAVSRLRRRQPRMIGKDDAVRQATEAGAFVLLHPPATRARCHHSTTPLCPLRGRVPLELLSR